MSELCRFCSEYDVEDYDDCVAGELCPNCHEYHIPDNATTDDPYGDIYHAIT